MPRKTASWDDIEKALNAGTLEDQDRETLAAFQRVEPPSSSNPAFHARFADAKERIRHRLRELSQEESPMGVAGGVDRTQWLIQVLRLTREMRKKAKDAEKSRAKATVAQVKEYLQTDFGSLQEIWPARLKCAAMSNLARHIHFSQKVDFCDMQAFDLSEIDLAAEKYALSGKITPPRNGFENMLHPVVVQSSLKQHCGGHYRDAVLNAVVGLFDHIRQVSCRSEDGARLVNEVFGGAAPSLIFSNLTSESGRNDQAGFHKILLGTYEGVRNPKAHSLVHDLNAVKAAQYLVFISLLCRRIDECHPAP